MKLPTQQAVTIYDTTKRAGEFCRKCYVATSANIGGAWCEADTVRDRKHDVFATVKAIFLDKEKLLIVSRGVWISGDWLDTLEGETSPLATMGECFVASVIDYHNAIEWIVTAAARWREEVASHVPATDTRTYEQVKADHIAAQEGP